LKLLPPIQARGAAYQRLLGGCNVTVGLHVSVTPTPILTTRKVGTAITNIQSRNRKRRDKFRVSLMTLVKALRHRKQGGEQTVGPDFLFGKLAA